MGLLHVSYDGVTVTAMRPEYPDKSFSSGDVPHGADSVYVKAAKILVHSHGKVLTAGIPQFERSEIDTKVSTQKTALSDVGSYTDPTEEGKNILDRTEVLIPSNGEIQDKIDVERGFTDEEAQSAMDMWNEANPENTRTLDQQKAVMRKRDKYGIIIVDFTEQGASDALIDERKQLLAELQVGMIIEQCLEVSTVSQDFKDQFTTTETEE